jgi:hypothetical protein
VTTIEAVDEDDQPLAKSTAVLIEEYRDTFSAAHITAAVRYARRSVQESFARYGLDQAPREEYETLVLEIARHRLDATRENAMSSRRPNPS